MSSPRATTEPKPKPAAKTPAAKARTGAARKDTRSGTPVAASPAGGDASAWAVALAREIDRALADGRVDALTPQALQALMAALCKCYSMQVEAGSTDLPVAGRDAASGTDIMTVASGLLKAGNLAVFELGMWQAWTGR